MTRRTHQAYALVFRALLSKSCTMNDLCNASQLSYDTVTRFVLTLRKRPRQLRICDWALDSKGRASVRVFELGTEPDAPKPRPRTGAERMAALKARKRQQAAMTLNQIWNDSKHGVDLSAQEADSSEPDDGACAALCRQT